MALFDPIWTNLIKFEPISNGLNQFEPSWSKLNQFEPIWISLNKFEQMWPNLIYLIPIWSNLIQFFHHLLQWFGWFVCTYKNSNEACNNYSKNLKSYLEFSNTTSVAISKILKTTKLFFYYLQINMLKYFCSVVRF